MQQAVAAGQSHLTLGLRVTDEGDADLGRWFDNNLRMSITYDTPPDTPAPTGVSADSSASPRPCGASSPGPWVNALRPTLFTTVSDPDGESNDVTLAVWPVDDPARRITFPGGSASSGNQARGPVPAGILADGGSYAWSAQATDPEGLTSGWSAPCYFSVDVTRPDRAPTITSTDYPADGTVHGGQGIPGTFTFTANGVADVAGYSYDWSGAGPQGYVPADHLGGPLTVTLAPPQAPISTLHVVSRDRAGNRSPDTTYQIYTRSTVPLVTVVTTQPKAGGTVRLELKPGVSLPGYEVTGYTYTVNWGDSVSVAAGPDGTATADVPVGYGSNNIEVKSVSGNGWISPAASAYVYADNSPTVESDVYPENADGGAAGRTGTFTLTANLADSTMFYYSWDYGATWESLPVGSDGRASFDWTPQSPGNYYLFAYSQTADGTQSDWCFYNFNVA